jgi:hypothetical protein
MWLSGYRWDGSNLVKALIHQTTAIVASLVTRHRLIRLYHFRKDRKGFFRSVYSAVPRKAAGKSIPIILVDIHFFPVIFSSLRVPDS